MGRIFETRKATMFRRWDRMAKQFARIGKDITIAVKAGGPLPENNPALRRVIQNARAVNMPKDKVEAAIKRASGQGAAAYEEVLYEGYAPHGVAVLVETATDNPTRTVASVRSSGYRSMGSSSAPSTSRTPLHVSPPRGTVNGWMAFHMCSSNAAPERSAPAGWHIQSTKAERRRQIRWSLASIASSSSGPRASL